MILIKGNEKITKLMNQWYIAMRSQSLLSVQNLKIDVEGLMKDIEKDDTLSIYYKLLEFRYDLMENNMPKLDRGILELEEASGDKVLKYYYHFFTAIYFTKIGRYSDAKKNFNLAEELIVNSPDELEVAEFTYQFAIFNYYTYQPLNAMNYVVKAKNLYLAEEGYEGCIALCENIMGLASTSLKQYELAEEHFITALDIATKQNYVTLALKIRHNLGLLYSDQNIPELAINHLSKSLESSCKTMFLLAKEYAQLNKESTALTYIEKGLELCREQGNKEYVHHLSILNARVRQRKIEEFDCVVRSGIRYFEEEELWHFVQKYAEEMANKYYYEGNHLKVSEYFHIGYHAKQEMEKRGALK
ncbi:tetratricopeptide repeat protein [Bacillus fungorum]|uniref:Uncharacterized protein n=1 Tax=Bacillus fungorum TaxID=2039284 RepID=A0A2G6QC54_9BACI|nr:tetratricopeptide repeat protein [Bacillus fungorum]PIE94398.1 hypothetical protein CO726_16340 [Bacillus fungorum]